MAYVPSQDPFTLRMQNAAAQGDSGSGYAGSVDPYQQWGGESWQLVSGRPGDPTIYLARQRPGGGPEDYMKVELALGPDGQYQATGKVEDYQEDPSWKQGVGIAGVLAGAGLSGLMNGFGAPTGVEGAAVGAPQSGGLFSTSPLSGAGTAGIGAGELGSGMYGVGTAGGFAAPELATGLGTGFAGTAPMVGTLPAITPWGVGSGITSGLATGLAGGAGTAAQAGANAVSNGLLADAGMAGAAGAAGGAAGSAGSALSNLGGAASGLLKDYPWLLPLLGGVGGYLDAKNQPDRMNTAPQNVQDVLNNQMMNPPKSPWMRY